MVGVVLKSCESGYPYGCNRWLFPDAFNEIMRHSQNNQNNIDI